MPSGVRGSSIVAPDGGSLVSATGAPDLVAVRAELAAGGWVAGRRLDLYYELGGRFDQAIAFALKRQLSEVGVEIALHGLDAKAFNRVGVGASPTATDVDLLLRGMATQISDPSSFHRGLTCASTASGLNSANYCSAALDEAYAAATAFAPFSTRLAAHRSVEQQLTGKTGAAMPVIPLYEPTGDFLLQRWVRGYTHHPSGRVDFERAWVDASRPAFPMR